MAENLAVVKQVKGLVADLDGSIGEIAGSLQEEKNSIHERLEGYRIGILPAETDEETEKAWASDRTLLNKERQGYDSMRKDLEKTWKSKVNPIVSELKDINAEFAAAIGNIDDQLSGLEEKRKVEKEKSIRALYLSEIPADFRERVSFERVMGMRDTSIKQFKTYSETLYNKGYTAGKIQDLFRGMAQDWQMAVNTIKGLNHKLEWDGLERFWETLDLNNAVAYMGEKQKQYDEFERREAARIEYEKQQAIRRAQEEAERQARVREAQIRQEEERKRREEEARIRAEEAKKQEAERQRIAEETAKQIKAAAEAAAAEARMQAAEELTMDGSVEDGIPEEPKQEIEQDGWGTWNVADPWSWGETKQEPKKRILKYVVRVPEEKADEFNNMMAGYNYQYIGEEMK